jgi:hypothetical protein
MKRTAPNSEVEQLHNNLGPRSEENFTMKCGTYECYTNIYGCTYDNSALWKNKRHPSIHDKKACFDEPYGQDLHLFHNQDEF